MSKYVGTKGNRIKKPYSRFKAYMSEHNITQVQLAEIIGKTNTTISQNLNGTAGELSLSDVRKICRKFKISSDEFFI